MAREENKFEVLYMSTWKYVLLKSMEFSTLFRVVKDCNVILTLHNALHSINQTIFQKGYSSKSLLGNESACSRIVISYEFYSVLSLGPGIKQLPCDDMNQRLNICNYGKRKNQRLSPK